MRFGDSFQFWRRETKVQVANVYDPFPLFSEIHLSGSFSDPNPLFNQLLKEIYKRKDIIKEEIECKTSKKGGEKDRNLKVNFWIIKCPYCGEKFPYKGVLKCPKCNKVIKNLDFKPWNKNLDRFMYGEISIKELYDSPVTPSSENYEKLRDVFLDPDIPKTKIDFGKGFDSIYKLFSPNQLLLIRDIIKEIRKKDENVIPIYSLALLDFITYNSMFSVYKKGKIYPIFSSKKPKMSWVEINYDYFCKSLEKIVETISKKKDEGRAEIIASHPFTLDIEFIKKVEFFFHEWIKRPLSYSNGYVLMPRLFKDYIFTCLNNCESFYEKDFEFSVNYEKFDKAVFYLEKLDYKSLLYLISLKDFHISKIEREHLFIIELVRGRKGAIPIWEIYSKIKKESTNDYLNILALTLREFTIHEKILGIPNKDNKSILDLALKMSSEIMKIKSLARLT